MSVFINPGALPGGREWEASCAAAAAAADGGGGAAELLAENLACGASAVSGLVQVLTLLAVYGFVLYTASGLIAEGSELLLLVPSLRNIVGSVVLPVLGAIPDGCIVFFSGLGENAQEEISVGVGALAGSTSMLLTVPWFLSVLAGRVNIRPDGSMNYTRMHGRGRWAKLMPPGNASLPGTGVEPMSMVAISGKIMGLTAVTYLVIQAAAFSTGNFFAGSQTDASTAEAAAAERMPAALCFLVAIAFFAWYLYYQLTSAGDAEMEYRESMADAVCQKAIQHGDISLSAAFKGIWEAAEEVPHEGTGLQSGEHKRDRLRNLLKVFFRHYDVDGDGAISSQELHSLMMDLGEHPSGEQLEALVKQMDVDGSETIEFEEFVTAMPEYIRGVNAGAGRGGAAVQAVTPPVVDEAGDGQEGGEEEEEEEVPHDLRSDDPKKQIQNVLRRSFAMMLTGTFLVLVFSDPMVDVLGEVGRRIGVSSFYISFILAPLASNASELFAAYQYATKKTRKTITISFSTLLGAAILNNTVGACGAAFHLLSCWTRLVFAVRLSYILFTISTLFFSFVQFVLAIFMALIYLKGLAWNFTAETCSILFVECVMLYYSQKKVQTLRDGYIVLALFPMSLLIVVFMENVLGFD
jgi:Ca2+/Na+ antiporter